MQRAHFLICFAGFGLSRRFDNPPSAFHSGAEPEQKERLPYRKVTTCVQLRLLEENNNGWHGLKTSVPVDGGVLTGPATHTSGLVSWWPPMA